MRTAAIGIVAFLTVSAGIAQTVRLVPRPNKTRVDVLVDGKLFTSYRWDEKIRRPVLLPIMSAGGSYITRGFPIETRDGESIDHPHQVGLALSYGDVNGIDYWNNSPYRTAEELQHMGRIVHKRIVSVQSSSGRGELRTEASWIGPNGKTILTETTTHVFHAKGSTRWIERETTLTAAGVPVTFGDSKEGTFGLHVASWLEQTDQSGVKITSATGTITERASSDGLTGSYFAADGLAGNDVWGKTRSWAAVAGRTGSEEVTVVVLDRSGDVADPPYLMVRGYGLLALNPFGLKSFDSGREKRETVVPAGGKIELKYSLFNFAKRLDARQVTVEIARLKLK